MCSKVKGEQVGGEGQGVVTGSRVLRISVIPAKH